MSRKTQAIRWTDAWAIYEAQMADYGIEVEFGRALSREGTEIEMRIHAAGVARRIGGGA